MGIYILLCLTTLLNIVLLLNNLHYLDNVISFTNSSLYEWENVNSKVNSIVLTSNVRVYYPGIMAPEYIQWVNDSSILFVTNDGVFIYDALKGRITFIASIPSGVTHSHTRKAFLVKNTIIIVRYDEVYFIKTIPINDTYYPIRMYSKSINPIGVFKDKVLGFKVDTIYVLDLGNDSIYLLTTLDYSIDRVIRYNDSCILVFHITEEGGLVISLINPWVKRIYWSLELSGVKSYAVSLNTRTDTLALVVKDAVWIKKKTLSSIILVEIGSGVVYNKTIDFQKEVGETSSVRCRWINNETLLIGFGNVLYFIYDIREEKLNYIGLWRNVVKLDDNLIALIKGETTKIAYVNGTEYSVVSVIDAFSDVSEALKKNDLIALSLFGRDKYNNPMYWIGGIAVYSMNGSLVSSVYSGDTGLVFTYTRDGYLVVIVCKAGKSQYILVYNNSYTLIYKTNFTISMSSADILGYSSKRIALAYKRYSEVKRILVIDVSSNKTLLDLCRNSSTKFFLIKSFKDIIQVVFGEIYSSRKTFYTINLSSGEIVSFALEPETTVGKIVGTGHNWVIVRYPYIVEVYTIDGESIAEISLSDIARDIDAGYDELYLYGINYRDGVLALLIELEKGIHSKYYLVLYGVDERQFIKAIPVEGIESVRNNYIEFIKDYIVVYSSSWYRVYILPEYRLVYSGSGIKVLSLIGESLYMLQSGKIIILNVVKNTSRVVKLPSKVLSDKTVSGLLVKAVGKYYIVLEGEIYTHVVELTTGRVISIQTPGLEDPYEIYLDPEANWVAIYSIGLYIIGDIPLESMLESAWTETSTSTTTPGTSASIISPTQTSTPHTEKTTKTPTTHTPTTNTSPEIESTKPTNTTSSTSTSTSNVKNQEGLLVTTIILIVFLLAIIAVIKVLRK